MKTNLKVLFVDDDQDVLDSLEQCLRAEPFDIFTASSASAGLTIMAAHDIDIVVSDERMPSMSGHEFLIKVYKFHPRTVRMMLSGQASLRNVSMAVNEGHIFKFLEKPIRPDAVKSSILEAGLVREQLKRRTAIKEVAVDKVKYALELEKACPGITKVKRDEDGYIVI